MVYITHFSCKHEFLHNLTSHMGRYFTLEIAEPFIVYSESNRRILL